MSLDDFRRLTERQMLASQVQSIEILNRVAITDVEAREYYEAHIDEFTMPATVTLREIIIAMPPAGDCWRTSGHGRGPPPSWSV